MMDIMQITLAVSVASVEMTALLEYNKCTTIKKYQMTLYK